MVGGTPWLRLLLLVVLAGGAHAGTGCDAPYKTLSTDCRGTSTDGKTACLVIDQSAGQASPCKSGTVRNLKECAAQSGRTCDVLSYKIDYQSTKARFRIKFQGDNWVASPDDALPAVSVSVVTTPTPTVRSRPMPTRVDFDDDPPSSETPSPTAASSAGPNAPFESNEFVEAIGLLQLDASLTEVLIVGGSSEFGTKGAAARLKVDPHMLVQSQHVNSLWIVNCNIGDQLSTGNLLSGMPTGLTDLSLRNTLMRAEPSDLSVLQNLRSLKMEQNYLTTLSSKVSLRKLTSLDLTENALTSFEAYLPAMESLYLNKNKLDSIPRIVYSMSKLQELQLAGNPVAPIVVSETQFDFLKKLRLLIDKPAQQPPAPVVYVPGPVKEPLPADITNLVVSSKGVDLTNAVAIPVGALVDLQGVPVWKVPDAIFEVFEAQQDAASKSLIVVGGKKVEPYKSASATTSASSNSGGSFAEDATTGETGTLGSTAGSSSSREYRGSSPTAADVSSPSGSTRTNSSANGLPSTSTLESTINTTTSEKSHKTTTLSLSLAVVGVLAAVVVGVVFVRQRRRHEERASEDNGSAYDVTTPGQPTLIASYKMAGLATSDSSRSCDSFRAPDGNVRDLFSSRRLRPADLEDVRPIAAGSSGVVWLVKWRGSRLLASKRLIQSAGAEQRMAEFVNEVVIAANLDYPHIVQLVGVSWTNETDLQALYEYMPNGDLEKYLHHTATNEPSAWTSSKLQMAIDIVEALVYTHSFSPPLLHRDLRTRNVLLDDELKPKLSNFGSARYASEQNTMTTDGVGSGRWLAPEVLLGSTDYDQSSDMYAFGVLLCELDTHSAPYEDVRDGSGGVLSETALLELVSRGELRPSVSASCPPTIRVLVAECLSQDPSNRPTAMRVAYELRGLKREWDRAAAPSEPLVAGADVAIL